MTDVLTPRDGKEVEDAVQWALGSGKTLDIAGSGTKCAIGRPAQSDHTLDLSAISGVTLYEPEELVLSAKAGTPLAEIEALVAERKQELAFEPMDYGPLLGTAGGGTLGGAIAANLAGPRRIKVGAARDHFLGFTAVSGRGEIFKSGGRVVKNVTGYDLCKLMAGSWGTLAAMTDVTIKVLPAAETEETVALSGLSPTQAIAAMSAAMASSCDVSGAAHLPGAAAARAGAGTDAALTVLRLEGVAPSVVHRRDMLSRLLRPHGDATCLGAEKSRTLWRAIRDVLPFAAGAVEAPLWRVSTAPTEGAAIAAAIGDRGEVLFDWAGGLLWIALSESKNGGADLVRGAVAQAGGHATLIRAPAAVRAMIDVFQPQAAPVAELTKRIKQGFDPKGILNPGRMYAGV